MSRTDLSILNDIEVAHCLYQDTWKKIYMGGCLVQRMDIPLPDYLYRLNVVRTVGQEIVDRTLIDYEPSFKG